MNALRLALASKLFRPLLVPGLLIGAAGVPHARAAQAAHADITVKMPPATWAWRQAVEEGVDSQAAVVMATRHNEALSPLLLRAGADPDLVTMAPVRVNGARLAQEIKREYAIAAKREKDAAVLHRLGTGMHQVGNSHFGVLTVFHIPVFAGFQWSW